MHHSADIEIYFEHLKNCGNDQTIEHIIDQIYTWEIRHGHNGSEANAVKCLMENIKSTELKDWLFCRVERGCIYSLKQKCGLYSPSMENFLFGFSLILGIISLILFYFDLYKDVMFVFILRHIWTELLVSCQCFNLPFIKLLD